MGHEAPTGHVPLYVVTVSGVICLPYVLRLSKDRKDGGGGGSSTRTAALAASDAVIIIVCRSLSAGAGPWPWAFVHAAVLPMPHALCGAPSPPKHHAWSRMMGTPADSEPHCL